MFASWNRLSLATQILVCMALGVVAGVALGDRMALAKPVGDMFIASIQMMVILIIAPSLISGFCSVDNPGDIGKTGMKIVGLFAVLTLFAGFFALFMVNTIKPGVGMVIQPPDGYVYQATTQSAVDMIKNIIPKNPVKAFADGNLLQILFVTILFASIMTVSTDKKSVLRSFFDDWARVAMNMLGFIMKFAPYATFALIGWSVGVNGPQILGPLAFFIICLWGCEFLLLLLNVGLVALFGMNPLVFLKNMFEVILLALSTCSSLACLGVNLKAVERMGVPKGLGTFGITLGNTVNQAGTTFYQTFATIFIAQAYGVDLPLSAQVAIMTMATLITIAAVGVPGVGTATIGVILLSAGLPPEGLGFILAVDRIVDMPRTMNNVVGDAASTLIASKLDGFLAPDSILLKKSSAAAEA